MRLRRFASKHRRALKRRIMYPLTRADYYGPFLMGGGGVSREHATPTFGLVIRGHISAREGHAPGLSNNKTLMTLTWENKKCRINVCETFQE